jgi:hypothetical protein
MRLEVCSLLFLGSLTVAGCGERKPADEVQPEPQPQTYSGFGNVTRVEIKDRRDELIHRIEDKEQIQKIVAFVDEHRSGWGRPWYGIPVPQVMANFYDGQTFKGHFGVGRNFFETQREGEFASKDASAEQCRTFLGLIGVDKIVLEK